MKHQWVAYVIVAILSIGAGVAIAGLPDSVPQSETIIPPTTTLAPEPTVPSTTTPAPTTTDAPDDTEPDETTTTVADDEADDTTTTIAELEPRADVNVAVANGSGRAGVAVATAADLTELGYVDVAALNGVDTVDETIVYYAPDNIGLAERLAVDLGLDPSAVAPLDIAPEVVDLGLVQLLVYVGAADLV